MCVCVWESEAEPKCLSLTGMVFPLLCVGKRTVVFLSVNFVLLLLGCPPPFDQFHSGIWAPR